MIVDILLLFIVIGLLLCSGFFSSSETALFSLSHLEKSRIQSSNEPNFRSLRRLLTNINELLVTVLFGNTLVNILLSTLLDAFSQSATFVGIFSNELIRGLVTIFISTALIITFGEILPKTMAIRFPFKIALTFSPVLRGFQWIIFPIRFVLHQLTEKVTQQVVKNMKKVDHLLTDQDFRMALKIGVRDQILPREEYFLLENIIGFLDLKARHIMTPRTQIFALQEDTPFSKALYDTRKEGIQHFPIYRKNIDEIVGTVHLKTMIQETVKRLKKPKSIQSFLRKPYFIPESKPLLQVLEDFKHEKLEMMIVVDEFGGTSGIITLTDVLEAILGKITDERERPRNILSVKPHAYLVYGETSIEEFRKSFQWEISETDADTIAGYLLEKMGKIPTEKDHYQEGVYHFRIKHMDQQRIDVIYLTILPDKKQV